MQYLVSGKEMKFLDENTSRVFQVPELVLMEQAAIAFVAKLFSFQRKMDRVLIVCGSGNNGGDSFGVNCYFLYFCIGKAMGWQEASHIIAYDSKYIET